MYVTTNLNVKFFLTSIYLMTFNKKAPQVRESWTAAWCFFFFGYPS